MFKLNIVLFSKITNNQRGQGLIEYVLLLFISVVVVIGLIFQFNQSFRSYADNYFGSYVKCLLRAGELPNLGIGEQERGQASVCNAYFQEFSLSEGRPPKDNSSSRDSSVQAGNSKGTGSSSNKNKFRASGQAQSGRFNNGGRKGFGGSSSANSRSKKFPAGPNKDSSDEKDDVTSASGSSSTINTRRRPEEEAKGKKKERIVGKYGSYGSRTKDKKESSKKVKVRGITNNENTGEKKSFRVAASVKKTNMDETPKMSFGDYFRYIIIACILIVLLLILGGQALQMSKSTDN